MFVKQVEYARLKSCGYDHEKIGVVVELDPDDKANDALLRAKSWVNTKIQTINPVSPADLRWAMKIIAQRDKALESKDAMQIPAKNEILTAEKIIKQSEDIRDAEELPF